MLKLKFRLDGKITSVNKIYLSNKRGGVFLAPEVKKYREEQKPIVEEFHRKAGCIYEGGLLIVDIHVHASFFTKAHEIRRLDVDNFAKNILDTVFPALRIDDKAVFDIRLRKVNYDGNPYITIKIQEIPKGSKKGSEKL